MPNTNTSVAIKNFPSSILGTPQPSYRQGYAENR
jgi:hypothetical protein